MMKIKRGQTPVVLKSIGCLLLAVAMALTIFSPRLHAADDPQIIKITIIPHRSLIGNEKSYQPLFKALENETGYVVRFIGSGTYEDVIQKLREKTVDIGYLGPFAYVTAQDEFGVRLLARTLDKDGAEFYKSIIITRKDSKITSLADLAGKSFAFTDPQSTSGFLFPMVGLQKAGIKLGDFSKIAYVKRHANSVLAVFSRQIDAGATSSTTEDKVSINFEDLRIIWESDPIYRGPWAARKEMPDEKFERIRDALLRISGMKNADKVFENLSTKGFVRGKDSDYDNVREALKVKRMLESESGGN